MSDLVVPWSGDVDLDTAPSLYDMTMASFNLHDMSCLVVDLTDVSFLDSMGLGALVNLRTAARLSGVPMRLRGIPPHVWKLIAMTGLASVFDYE